ncbi:DMT family transporter [Polymorphum gilvum]|uniref:Hypothetical transmembrane protein n=1 Tax=Polymorphum gilvum (strain LMG 25793 / CGMCC 1.9160 / SL003B-26A1) TaxID=991905 RepID=F2J5Y1_POLGS|nr:DMT family transporter [Polymorphum gilvum]ADZ71235.1 Hypothetical transmembrane protein [Polymorphum gilvum SL003B-26A1]
MDFRDNGKAIAAMLLAMAAFIFNDALVKLTYDQLPLGQIILVRSLISLAMIYVVCVVTGATRHFRHLLRPIVAWRTLGEVMATLLYLSALIRMPIANVTAILQVLPLAVTAVAAILFGAPVGWRRWTAIAVGFAGVLLIIRPGLEGFDAWSLLALASLAFIVLRDMSTQRMPSEIQTFGVTLVACVGVSLLGGGLVLIEGWQPMTGKAFLLLCGAATFLLIGYITLIFAMRLGDVAVVAPFRYSIILWAMLMGFVVWGDIPDVLTLAGTAIVVATGIYTFFRERRLAGAAGRNA